VTKREKMIQAFIANPITVLERIAAEEIVTLRERLNELLGANTRVLERARDAEQRVKLRDAQLAGVEVAAHHLIDGLQTDGGHHKQWEMDQALRALVGKAGYNYLQETEVGWEPGIPG